MRSSREKYLDYILHYYTVAAVLPSHGRIILVNSAQATYGLRYTVQPLIGCTGQSGVHITAAAPRASTVYGSSAALGLVLLSHIVDNNPVLMPPLASVLGCFEPSVCMKATDSRYVSNVLRLLLNILTSYGAYKRSRSALLLTSWQGDYSVRDVTGCAGIFVGRQLIQLQAGNFCSLYLCEVSSKLCINAADIQCVTTNTLDTTDGSLVYHGYTPYGHMALGYRNTKIFDIQLELFTVHELPDKKYKYNTLVLTQTPESGVYMHWNIDSDVLGMSALTILDFPQDADASAISFNLLQSLYCRTLLYTGKLSIFAGARTTVVADKAPGVIYWESPCTVQLPQDTLYRDTLKQIRSEYPAMASLFILSLLNIPLQYKKAFGALSNTRVLQAENAVLKSIITQLPDGSIVLRDRYGSELRMTGGNIYISAANSIYMLPGADLLCLAGRTMAINAAGVLISGIDGITALAGGDVKVFAGAKVASGRLAAVKRAGSVYINGDSCNISCTAWTKVVCPQLTVSSADALLSTVRVYTGNAGSIYFNTGLFSVAASLSFSVLASGRGILVDNGNTVIAGLACYTTGSLVVGQVPVVILGIPINTGSPMLRTRYIQAESVSVYNNLAVKLSILCKQLGYTQGQGQVVLRAGLLIVSGIYETVLAATGTAALKYSMTDSLYTIWIPAHGVNTYGYVGYQYAWQRAVGSTKPVYTLVTDHQRTVYYAFPGRPGDISYTYVLKDGITVRKENALLHFAFSVTNQ